MSVENWIQRMDRFVSQFGAEELPTARKKIFFVSLLFLALYSIVRGVAAAAFRPFWFDELLTLSIASQPNLHDMWVAITRGFDSQPPPFYFLERVCLALPIRNEISLRLPSILSFPLLLICVFTFAKRRVGHLVACVCAFAVLWTSLFHIYSIEARGYMLANACIAFALVCYQRLPCRRWAVMLAVGLFLANAFHYYAVFAVVPFGLAELVFSVNCRQFRWFVWAALVFGVLPIFAFLPLLAIQKAYYGPNVFFRLETSHWIWAQSYGAYFFTTPSIGVALAVLSGAAILLSRPATGLPLLQGARKNADLPETAVLLGFVLMPLIVFLSMRVLHGGMLERHALPATIGVVLGLASGSWLVRPRGVVLFALFAVTSIGSIEAVFWFKKAHEEQGKEFSLRSRSDFFQIEKFVQSGGHSDLLVVYAHAMAYTQVVHYAPSSWTNRLVCLVSQRRALEYEKADSLFLATKGLGEFYPIKFQDYDEFTSTHQEFLLYADRWEWPLRSLIGDAVSMQLLRADGDMRLFLVKMKKGSAD